MTKTFHLVRHGTHGRLDRTLCGRMPDVHISTEGLRQAEGVAEILSGEVVGSILSSPRERARETADIIAKQLALPVTLAEALDEWDAGSWTGRSFDELRDDPAWQAWNLARSTTCPPGGETAIALQARIVGFVLDTACGPRSAAQPDVHVLVSHAEPLRALVLHALGLGPDGWSRIDIAPGSLTTLLVGAWGFRLTRLNERPRQLGLASA